MKPLNFIDLNKNQKKNNVLNYLLNFFFIIILVIILVIQAKQLYSFFNYKKEHKDINFFIENQKNIIKESQELNKKYKNLKLKVDNIRNPKNRPDIIIKKIAQIIPIDCYLKEFGYSNKKITSLIGTSRESKDLASFLKSLAKDKDLPIFSLNSTKKDPKTGFIAFDIKSNLL